MTLKKNQLVLEQVSSAAETPGAGKWVLYFKGGGLYVLDDAGIETGPFGIGGGAAGLVDGEYGSVTVSGGGTIITIDSGAVSLAMMASMATASILGRNTAGVGVPEVLSAATVRSVLGLVVGATVQGYDAQLASNIPQNSQSAAYTLVLADGGKHIYHPDADTTARIWTIPANASVAFPIGTVITFVNGNGAGVITLSITTDTMRRSSTGSTGSRTLAANEMITALKIAATVWTTTG